MTRIGRYTPVCLWAAQEVQRRAGRSILLFACLASLVLHTTLQRLPAAALRGFTKVFSPSARSRAFIASKPARGMKISPRTSR